MTGIHSDAVALEDLYVVQSRGHWIWWKLSGSLSILKTFTKYLETLIQKEDNYYFAQYEEDERDGLHLQGILYFKKQLYASAINKIFSKWSVEWGNLKSKEDVAKMTDYVHREETRYEESPVEGGVFPKPYKSSRKHRKEEYYHQVKGMSKLELRESALRDGFSHEDIRWMEKQSAFESKVKNDRMLINRAQSIVWRPWQQWLANYLSLPAHEREIIVILDRVGNTGKTYFMKNWKILNQDTVCNITNGKTSDLMHVIAKKPCLNTVLINLPRSVHGKINYEAIEQAKDGEFTNTKYDGFEVTILPPRMVIFTNEPLNWEACSKDRWKIMTFVDDKFELHSYDSYKTVKEYIDVMKQAKLE